MSNFLFQLHVEDLLELNQHGRQLNWFGNVYCEHLLTYLLTYLVHGSESFLR